MCLEVVREVWVEQRGELVGEGRRNAETFGEEADGEVCRIGVELNDFGNLQRRAAKGDACSCRSEQC